MTTTIWTFLPWTQEHSRRARKHENPCLLLVAPCLGLLVGATLLPRIASVPPVAYVPVGRGPSAVAIDGVLHRAFVVNHDDASLTVVDLQRKTVIRTVKLSVTTASLAVDTQTARVFVAETSSDSHNGQHVRFGHDVIMLDAHDGRIVRTTVVGEAPGALTIDASRGRVFVGVSFHNHEGVQVLDARHGTIVQTIILGPVHTPTSAFAPSSPCALGVDEQRDRVIVVGEALSTLDVIDAASGRLVKSTPVPLHLCPEAAQTLAVDERAGHTFVGIGVPTNRVLMFDNLSGALLHTTMYARRSDEPRIIAADSTTEQVFALVGGFGGVAIHVLDAQHDRDEHILRGGFQYYTFAVDASQHHLFLARLSTLDHHAPANLHSSPRQGLIDVVDTRTDLIIKTVTLSIVPSLLSVDPETNSILVISPGVHRVGHRPGTGVLTVITVP